MNPTDDPRDEEEPIASLLGGLNNDAALPDREFLAKLRAQSTDAFALAEPQKPTIPERKRPMFFRMANWMGTVAAVAIVVLAGLYFAFDPGASGVALGQALENSEKAETAHFRFLRGDSKVEYWHTKKPERARWDDSAGNYRIADGAKFWAVNESANEVRRVQTPAKGNQPVQHFLDLLGVPADRAKLIGARPTLEKRENNVDLLVYHVELPGPGGKILLDCFVDADLKRVRSLRAVLEKAGKTEFLGELIAIAYDEPIGADKFAIADTLTEDGRIGKITDVQGVVGVKPVLYDRWTPVREHMVLRPGDWVRTDARGANAVTLRLVKQTSVILGPKTLVELMGPKQIRVVEGEVEITPVADAAVELFGPNGQPVVVRGPRELTANLPKWFKEFANGDGQVGLHNWYKAGKDVEEFKKIDLNEDGFITPAEALKYQAVLAGNQAIVAAKQLYRVEKERLVRVMKDPPWLLGFKGATANETLGSLVAMVDGRNVPLSVGYHKVSVDIHDQIARTTIEESFVNHTDAQLEGVFYFPLPQDASISGFGMWIGDNLVEADVVEKQRAREIYETILRERRDPGLLEWNGGNIFKARVFPIFAHSEKRIKITYTQVLPLKGSRYRYSYALQSEMLQQKPLRELSIDVKVNSALPLKSVSSPTHPTRDELTTNSAHVEFTAQEYTPSRDFEVVVEVDGRQADVVVIPHRRGDDGYFLLQLNPPGAAGDWQRPLLPNGEPVNLVILADTSASIDASQRATQAAFLAALLSSLTPKDTFNLGACDVKCEWAFPQPSTADAAQVALGREFLAKRTSLGWTNLDAAFADALKQCGPKSHIIYLGDGIVTTGDADPVAFANRLRRLYQGHTATLHAVSLGNSFESGVLKAIASLGGGSMRKIGGDQSPPTVALELLGEIAQPALRDVKVEFKGIKAARVYPEALANVPGGSQQILLGRYLPEGKDQSGEIVVTGTLSGKPVRFSTRVALKDAEHGNSFIPRLWARMHLDSLLEQGASEIIKDEIIALSEEYQIITPYTSLLVLETDADRERFKVKRRFQMRDGERFFADGRDNAVFDLTQKQMKRAADWRTALRRSVLTELAGLGREPQPSFRDDLRAISNTERGSKVKIGAMSAMDEFLGDGGFDGDVSLKGLDFRQKDLDALHLEDRATKLNEFASGPRAEPAAAEPFGGDGLQLWDGDRMARMESSFDGSEYFGRGMKGSSQMMAAGAAAPGQFMGEAESLPYSFLPMRPGLLLSKRISNPRFGQWLDTLFPQLAAAPRPPREPKSEWPAAARELVKSLLRTDKLAQLPGGLEIVRASDGIDPRWGETTSRSRRLELLSARSWVTRSEHDGGQTLISWCDGKDIGVFSQAFQLGRVRAATPRDSQPPPLELNDFSLVSLEQSYANHTARIEAQGEGRTLLVLTYPHNAKIERRILVDTARRVILSIEDRRDGKVFSTMKFDDFIQAGGLWWARRIETSNEDEKNVSIVRQTIKELTAAEFEQQSKIALAGRADAQLVRLPLPSVVEAKKALVAGKAGFDDAFVLILHFGSTQQWPRVMEHLQKAEAVAAGKPGLRWLRSAILLESRRHDELRQRHLDDAARLAKTEFADAYYLAEYLLGQAARTLQANEMLALLDVLRPLYERQPPHVGGRKHWLVRRLNALSQARPDEAQKLRQQLAVDYPRDYNLQRQYAHSLAEEGDYPASYAWLNRILVKESKWLEYEEDTLRSAYGQLMQNQGRFAELADYLAGWVAQNPGSRSAYEQYLSALIRSDQIEKADELVLKWLKDAMRPGELPPPVAARLDAAVALMLGNAFHRHTNRVDERWWPHLMQTALFFAKHETQLSITDRIVRQYQFRRTEEGRGLRKTLAGMLSAEVETMPAGQVRHFVGWLETDDRTPGDWRKIADALRKRWSVETKDDAKHVLGEAILIVLAHGGQPDEALAFVRLQWQKGPEKRRIEYANQLFNRLLGLPWSVDVEHEAFALLDKLSAAEEPGEPLLASVQALHRLDDTLLANRIAAGAKAIKEPEKLTRIELRKKQDENVRLARESLADRLRTEAAKHPAALAQWLIAESLYYDLLLDRNLQQATAAAWEALGAAPPVPPNEEWTIERALDEALRRRYFATVMNLAARKGAEPALAVRLAKYIDQGMAADGEGRWKQEKYRYLIALDRSKELEQMLRDWVRQDDTDSRWRVALAYVLAEQGQVAEAVRQFEAVEAVDELSPSAWRMLSDLYLVQGQRDLHDKASLGVFRMMSEYGLRQAIAMRLNPWQRPGHRPTELDKDVLRLFAVLFEKSGVPQNYLYQLQQFYQASHDFRLLSMLPDAVVGHTPARVYPFIQGMQSVLAEVRDEATADEIVKRIGEVRGRAKTAVDLRALDLLEVQVERRAAEVQNQAGPHVDAALAALERASKREWSPGEPRLMADFLAGLGHITQKNLAAEQLRQLKALHIAAAAGSLDRLHVALAYAGALNNYNRSEDAIDLLQTALDEFQAANDGVLPISANIVLSSFIRFLENAGHFARGEKALQFQLEHPAHAQQRRWLNHRLGELYRAALDAGGEVSLGKDLALYQALTRKIQASFADDDQTHRHQSIVLLTHTYRTAFAKRLPGVVDDLRTFAFDVFPKVLQPQSSYYDSLVGNVAFAVHDLAGAKSGIDFFVREIEREPRWLRDNNQDGWSRHGFTIARWRVEAGALGDVEARLLKVVVAELRRDLLSREQRTRTLYHRQNDQTYFWTEKAADFAKTAEAVLAERNQSGATAQYIAEYFYWGLDQPKRAIEILFSAHSRKLLDEEGQDRLVDFLHRQDRHAESIPVLQPLVERRPENIDYRVRLMHSYFRASRKTELLELLKQTDAFFHEKNRWSQNVLARMAQSTLQNELFEASVAYFKELIPLHERTQPNRGVGDNTLAVYYSGMANAYAGLNKTAEAVDAAGGAIVAWGRRHDQRALALETLRSVLQRSPDLDAFVAEFDQRKDDSAIIRKALGQSYRDKGELAKAITQLRLAVDLQSGDTEIHQFLIATLDKAGDKDGALRQLLAAVQLSRRDGKLYEDLGNRYASMDQLMEAERAFTSIVEVLPTESESHALLAEVREKQDRWGDAIAHWQHVARIRALEPTGLLKLAAAQIHEKQWDQAHETIRKLNARSWPGHFGNVPEQTRQLDEQIRKKSKNS